MRKSVDDVGWEILSEILREFCLRRDNKSEMSQNFLILNKFQPLLITFNT